MEPLNAFKCEKMEISVYIQQSQSKKKKVESKIKVRYECQNQELSYTIPVACCLVSNISQEVLVLL